MFSPRFGPRNILLFFISVILLVIFFTLNVEIESNSSEIKCIISEKNATKTISDWKQQLRIESNLPPIAGFKGQEQIQRKKFLSIGISTLYRKENYIRQTLESFVYESTAEEREETVIIIFLADTDPIKRNLQLQLILKHFQEHLNSGFIYVIKSSYGIYPKFGLDFENKIKTKFTATITGDSFERLKWKSKQVIDFAFLISYAANLTSDFYLVMEDDIITVPRYITAIKEFIHTRQNRTWVALRFSMFVGIGLLLKRENLSKLVEFLMLFYKDLPVDMLLRKFVTLLTPEGGNLMRRIPSIFQHFGLRSTLSKKIQVKVDKTFDIAQRKFRNKNPPADIFTNMKIYQEFYPQYPYKETPGFFWGIVQKPGDTFDIVFPSPIPISRVVILTGITTSARYKKVLNGTLNSGYLEVGQETRTILPNGSAFCQNYKRVAKFTKGIVDVEFNDWENQKNNETSEILQCLRVKMSARKGSHVIIKEIQIF